MSPDGFLPFIMQSDGRVHTLADIPLLYQPDHVQYCSTILYKFKQQKSSEEAAVSKAHQAFRLLDTIKRALVINN